MNKEERLSAPNDDGRIEGHSVGVTEMVESETMPENLLPGESIKKLGSRRQGE